MDFDELVDRGMKLDKRLQQIAWLASIVIGAMGGFVFVARILVALFSPEGMTAQETFLAELTTYTLLLIGFIILVGLILGIVNAWSVISIKRKSQRKVANTPSDSEKRPWEEAFNEMAAKTAENGIQVIDAFCELAPRKKTVKQELLLKSLMQNNATSVSRIISDAAKLYSKSVDKTCCCTVLIVTADSDDRFMRWQRDQNSLSKRNRRLNTDVELNDGTLHLIREHENCYIRSELDTTNFNYSRKGWDKDFNAVAIFRIADNRRSSDQFGQTLGFLCIDTLGEIFNETSHKNWGLQIAARLAPMLKLEISLRHSDSYDII